MFFNRSLNTLFFTSCNTNASIVIKYSFHRQNRNHILPVDRFKVAGLESVRMAHSLSTANIEDRRAGGSCRIGGGRTVY